MKHTETIHVPASTYERVVKTTCDLCGKDCDPTRNFAVDDVTISRKVGDAFPECGSVMQYDFDCCGACFVARIAPLFPCKAREKDCGY